MRLLYIPLLSILLFSCEQKTSHEEKEQTKKTDTVSVLPEQLIGAWETSYTNDSGVQVHVYAIVTDRYLSAAGVNDKNEFLSTSGGSWRLQDKSIVLTYEFNTGDSSMVGETTNHEFEFNDGKLTLLATNTKWTRIDQGNSNELAGAWLITGRKRDGEINRRDPGVRKTMKILSDTRFQWIAYNTETGEFFGTGGGTYKTSDSTYQENINFFSRDNSRVGASLNFNYKIDSSEWHHSGLSSKGDPIYEIWTQREELEE